MKKVFKILGYALLVIVGLLLCAAAYVMLAPQPRYEVAAPELRVTADSARLAEGHRIVSTHCASCHRGPDGKLSGDIWVNDDEFGSLWSANITRHETAGIGAYTDGELAYLFRTGVKRDGHYAGPWMTFPLLSDDDVHAVIAYLRSDAPELQPSERRQPPAKLTFLGNMVLKVFLKPLPYSPQAVTAPSPDDTIAYGRYLGIKWECYRCHSASFETNDDLEPEKSAGYFGGGNLIGEKRNHAVRSANLTPDPETGLGRWTEAQFAEAVRFGKHPDGHTLSPKMPPMSVLTDAEISALWAYLRTVPPIKNKVASNLNQ